MMDQIKFDLERYSQPTTKASWSGVEVVDYLKTLFDIPNTGPYGYTAWLRRVKNASISLEQAKKVVDIMYSRERWVQSKGGSLHRGKWMMNRFKEFKEISVDKWISKNSL